MIRLATFRKAGILAAILLAATGCQVYTSPPIWKAPYLERAQTQTDGLVEVTVAVLSAEESKMAFNADLALQKVQPVWVRIRNNDTVPYFIPPLALDPDYFAPHETAIKNHIAFQGRHNEDLDRFFQLRALDEYVAPDTTVSGFVFTNLDEGNKLVTIALIGKENTKSFEFLVDVPGLETDYVNVDFDTLYSERAVTELENPAALRAWFEAIPCCTTGEDGDTDGDPINLGFVGKFNLLLSALTLRGWDVTETVHAASVAKTIASSVLGQYYRYSPVSPLYVFGRQQDAALQKARDTVDQRNHFRLWLAPVRYQNQPVWVGQISRDIGVRLTGRLSPPTTHIIDPDIDESRWYLVQDLIYSQRVASYGLANGVGMTKPWQPRRNLLGDPYYTDGLRIMLILSDHPKSVSDLQDLGWEPPVDPTRMLPD